MQKILSTSRVTDTDSLASNIIDIYNKTEALSTLSYLSKIIANLLPVSKALTEAIKRIKLKSVLEDMDDKRDALFRSFYYLIQGNTHHPDKNISTASETIMNILLNYGLELTQEGYASESSMLQSLINDMQENNLQQALEVISGAPATFDALEAAQAEFNNAFISKKELEADAKTFKNASSLKMDVIKLINEQLVNYLNVMLQIDEEQYGDFARTVGQLIADNNNLTRRRSNSNTDEEAA